MKFTKAEDTELKARHICEGVELGIWPVLFGYRVRAGYVGDFYYGLDWCCGEHLIVATITMEFLMKMVEKDGIDVIKKLPGFSKIKPWYKDDKFIEAVSNYDESIIGIAQTLKKI